MKNCGGFLPAAENHYAFSTRRRQGGQSGTPVPTVSRAHFVVGKGLGPPEYVIKVKPCGEVAEEQLQMLEKRFSSVTVEDYVIMPDHIHAVILLHNKAGGASPSPTLDEVICTFKSLTSRICKQRYGIEKIFQRSFAEHIIRDREDYDTRRKYICENPMRWYYKHQTDKQ